MKDDAQHEAREGRTTLNGCWILDKTREPWSMNDYLQTMNVDPLAIEAHEKGEKEYETYHTIEFINQNTGVRIIKRSRVNNDVVVELTLGQESRQYLQPNDRLKSSIATSDHLGHLCIKSSLVTTDNHGTAIVTDIKRLQQHLAHPEATPIAAVTADAPTEEHPMMDRSTTDTKNLEDTTPSASVTTTVVLVQELTIQNVETGQSHTTTRYFLPYDDTPPHLVVAAAAAAAAATGDNQNAAEEDEDLMDD